MPLNETNHENGMKRLKMILGAVMLRRTKKSKDGTHLLNLPEKNISMISEPFKDSSEIDFYNSMEINAQNLLNEKIKVTNFFFLYI